MKTRVVGDQLGVRACFHPWRLVAAGVLFLVQAQLYAQGTPAKPPAELSMPETSIKSSVSAVDPVVMGSDVKMLLTLSDRVSSKAVTFDDLVEIHTKKIHLLVVDPSLSDYQHIHPDPASQPGTYSFSFKPVHGGSYKFFSDLLPVKTGSQEYSACTFDVPGKSLAVEKQSNREAEINGYKFALSLENPTLIEKTPTLATLTITGPDGKPFEQLEPVMGAFGHMVAFSEDRNHVVHVHPQGTEPTKPTERGGPKLTFYLNMPNKGYSLLYAQVQIGGKDFFPPFGLEVGERPLPKDTAAIFTETDKSIEKLRNVVEFKQLTEAPGFADWIKDVLANLPSALASLPDAKKADLSASLDRIKSYVDVLKLMSAAKDDVKAKGMVTRLVNEIDHLKILAGITPKVASAGKTEPKALGNKNCPVSGMQVGSMEPGAGIVYNNTLVGLCCNGCRTKFLSDPETYLKKATTEGH